MTLQIVPITLRVANDFVALHHRHNKRTAGHKFSVGLQCDGCLVGVAIAGRPVARALDDGLTLEVNRTCTDGTRNANSMLYGAVWRAARAMGYLRCVTYTQHRESGASLRAAGWILAKDLPPRASWKEASKKLAHLRDDVGTGGVARQRWEIRSASFAALIPPVPAALRDVPSPEADSRQGFLALEIECPQ